MVEVPGYQIEGEIARGGMGAVHRAVSTSTGERVAIKVLNAHVLDLEGQERFRREAQILVALSHPGLLRARSFGVSGGTPYLVTDLVRGESLRKHVQLHGPLPEPAALRLGVKLAGALAHAHERGVLHRDVKPENVMLTPEGDPVLVDFGVAKQLGDRGRKERLTQTGAILGTPAFMAPEQASAAAEAGPTADVYGIGATLFFALSGEAPFSTEGSPLAVMVRAATEAPRDLRDLRADLGLDLEAIVKRCLARDPGERYPSAGDLLQALTELVRATPHESSGGLARVSALLLVGACAVGATAAFSHHVAPASSAPATQAPGERGAYGVEALLGPPPAFDPAALRAAIAPLRSAANTRLRPEASLELGVRLALLGEVAAADSALVAGLERCTGQPALASQLHVARGLVLLAQEDFARAVVAFEEASRATPDARWPLQRDRAWARLVDREGELRAQRSYAQALERAGRVDDALAAYAASLALAPADPEVLLARARLGLGRADVTRQPQDAQRALRDVEAVLALRPESSPAHRLRAKALTALGRYDEAQKAYFLAIHHDPERGVLHYEVAEFFLCEEHLNKVLALHEFNRAIECGLDEPLRSRAQRTAQQLLDDAVR